MSSLQMSFASIESPVETVQRLNALAARRSFDKALAMENLCHGRIIYAIRTGNRIKRLKEENRYVELRAAKWRALEAWLDLPLWQTAKPRRK